MSQVLFGFGFTFITAMIVIIGDYAIKLAADGNHPLWSGLVLLGVVLYGASAMFWFYAMQYVTLAQAGVAYSMLTLLALAIIGAVYFDEALYAREYAGFACALLAMVLLSRVT
jgi:drug/metabolite transporter (DMT)-like permease